MWLLYTPRRIGAAQLHATPEQPPTPDTFAVFGRCIAGRGLGGNMGYFITIIAMGQLGWITAAVAVILGVAYRIVGADSDGSIPMSNGTLG